MSGSDKYFWTAASGQPIEEYIKKFRPSILTDDDTPWIWVQGSDEGDRDPETTGSHAAALVEAERILNDLEARLKEIEADDSIPTRAKKGQKSKKAVRDEAHEGAKESLKNLSKASKWTVGKWLLFPRHENVDGTWATIAKSVAGGPLKEAGVMLAKVAPTPSTPPGDTVSFFRPKFPGHISKLTVQITQVICLYMSDIYDLSLVRAVLTTLLTEHGIEPSAAKSDLYTLAGIDSNHPTKLRSSIWRTHEVIEGGSDAIKKMKDEHFARTRPKPSGTEGGKSKVGRDGIIESDSEDEKAIKKRKSPVDTKTDTKGTDKEAKVAKTSQSSQAGKAKASAALKFRDQDVFAGGSDSE